ncbi:MAG: MerR family transcriptional regulator [Pedobacter sp.]|nr:MerR family transcriptional regulator [Pedobacter sp.]
MNVKIPDVATETPLEHMLPIQAVERETGVSKELLRMWERRYQFPAPARDRQGDRLYDQQQINKLRLLRRLIDAGFRPGKIISMSVDELENLLRSRYSNRIESAPGLEKELIESLKAKDPHSLREYLSHQLVKMGLQSFILEFLQYANPMVGDAWMRGVIEVHEEHLYTEQVQVLVRGAIANLRSATSRPRIMLTTAPDEGHTLGILMTEAMLRLDEIDAICFGPMMPVRDIVQAAHKHHVDVVGISFSASFPTSHAIEFLEDLRFRLPPSVGIWAGGSALRSTRRNVDGVDFFHDLDSIRKAVLRWKSESEKATAS